MLLKRVITSVVLIPLVLLAIFYLPDSDFVLAVGFLLLLVAYEYLALIGVELFWKKVLYLFVLWFVFLVFFLLPQMIALWIGVVWWLLALFLLFRYPNIGNVIRSNQIVRGVIGLLILVPCWQGLAILHSLSPTNVLFLLLIVWASDTGAYFVGAAIGKRKLAPKISPKKTVAGVFGGVAASLIVVFIITMFLHISVAAWLAWIFLAIVTSLFSIIGDLFESMIKRIANVKDSGRLLPGHGGLFDRLDGLTAAAPIFTIGVVLIGLFG